MQAIVIHEHGGPDVLQPADIPVPEPASGEALVKVKAVSVNGFLDVSNRMGQVAFARYSFPHVLGSEHAGTIAALGPDSESAFRVGDQVVVSNRITCGSCANCRAGREEACLELGVIGVTTPGAYAQYSAVPVETVLRGPASRYARKWLKQQSNDVHLARLPATLSNDDERMDRRFVRCTLLTVCGNLSQEREAGVALTEAR